MPVDKPPQLLPGLVHVWKLWIGGRSHQVAALNTLSKDELERAAAFVFDVHRNRYISCRAGLRALLSAYLEEPPWAIEFQYSKFGKPEILGLPDDLPLRFNVSHCDDLAVVALTLQDRVGIDLERLRQLDDFDGLADMCFSLRELDVFYSVPPREKAEAFFNCWTRKEAFVKAIGEGLSYPLKDFDVTLRPGERSELISIRGSGGQANKWSVLDLRPLEGFVGAVAVESRGADLKVVDWLGEWPPAYL